MENRLNTWQKAIHWIICVIFLLFAFVQLNDPDPAIWVIVYGMVAVLFGIGVFKMIPKLLVYALMTGLFIFSMFHIQYFFDWISSSDKSALFGEMIYEKPYIEGTREFLGLMIAMAAMVYLLKTSAE